MDWEFKKPLSRRDFMKITTSLAAVGLTSSLTPDLLHAQTKTDLKGITIDYWCMVQQQNPIVKKLCISIVKAFEKKTGCKVNLTMEGYGSIIGPKYRTNFVAGKMLDAVNMKHSLYEPWSKDSACFVDVKEQT